MPVCPSCNAIFHTGAEDQCPVCGYSLKRADAVFGSAPLEFTRVVDEAGALTHQDRRDLMRALEDLERNIPPIALCIYITADGQAQEFRSHAHWALNHAHIHHPSFGRREKMRAIEDAGFAELRPGEDREHAARPQIGLHGVWQRLRSYVRDIVHPYPPPVKQEWMLILVLDVQLETACFSWGYMLDPYINPDSINSCIMSARLQFRERAMAVGLRKVMKAAVSQIAAQSYSVNRRLKRSLLIQGAALLLLSSGLISATPSATAAPTPPPAIPSTPWADEESAEEVEDDEAAPTEAAAQPASPTVAPPAPPPPEKPSAGGAAASYSAPPSWDEADYRHLLSGELAGGYRMLQPAPPSAAAAEAPPKRKENDAKVPKIYYREYAEPDKTGLIDPQKILTSVERGDVEHTLRILNARSPYRLYIALFKQGQELPLELAVGSLVRSVAQPGEYAALIMCGMGDTPQIELGYHEIRLSDTDRHAWLEKVRLVAQRSGGVNGLLAAAHELHACLAPVAAQLPPLTQRSTVQAPLIPLEMREDDIAEEISFKDEMKLMLENPALRPLALTLAAMLILAVLAGLVFFLRRRSGQLNPTEPDIRLSSPYGAGVSRSVRYLEGREQHKNMHKL